jgi:hypothetical protein
MKSIISLILIATSIAFFVFFTKPKWTELSANKIEVDKLRVAEENAKDLKLKIESLLKVKASITEENMDKIKRMVPDSIENVKLIINFDSMLQDLIKSKGTAGIYKKTNSESSDDFSIENPKVSKSTTPTEGVSDTSQLGVADFTFTVSLTYKDFLDFLKRIETSSRIFDVESISFNSPDSKDVKNPDEIIYNFNISLKTYWLKSK